MLKKRIDYLCKKKNISRKELVEGLVTPVHFTNILAQRYPLMGMWRSRWPIVLVCSQRYLLRAAALDEEALGTCGAYL